MPNQTSARKSALVLTHNFPRYEGDVPGVFLKYLFSTLRQSVDFTVLTPHDSGLKDAETVDGIKLHRFRYASDNDETLAYRGEMHAQIASRPLAVLGFLKSYKRSAIDLAIEGSYDFIWAHWWLPGGWIGEKVKSRANAPLLVTCHGTDVFLLNKYRWLRRTAGRVFRAANRITVVSGFLKEQLVESMRNRVRNIEEKIVVAPMPIDTTMFSHDERVQPLPGSIICASRLTSQKNIDKLIQAVARLRDNAIQFRVEIYGSGPERENLNRMIADLDLENAVQIYEPIPQSSLAEKYRQSEIAVLVSEREGFGLMLAEAMLCGCAAIGASSGGITDIVTASGEDGLLVDPGDVDSLHGALKNLLTDRQSLAEIRSKCRKSAENRFSTEVISGVFSQAITRL